MLANKAYFVIMGSHNFLIAMGILEKVFGVGTFYSQETKKSRKIVSKSKN